MWGRDRFHHTAKEIIVYNYTSVSGVIVKTWGIYKQNNKGEDFFFLIFITKKYLRVWKWEIKAKSIKFLYSYPVLFYFSPFWVSSWFTHFCQYWQFCHHSDLNDDRYLNLTTPLVLHQLHINASFIWWTNTRPLHITYACRRYKVNWRNQIRMEVMPLYHITFLLMY